MTDIRKIRGTTQNLFLIESLKANEQYERKYIVMGSTGNIYNVVIKNIPECSCPDYSTRHKRCKHIYFILLRVMKIEDEDQEEYTNNELLEMFKNIPHVTNNLLVDGKTKQKYDTLKNNNKLDPKSQDVTKKGTDDLCPICLDDLENGDDLDHCKFSCGKSIHKVCYSMWTKKKAANCIFCGANWNEKNSDVKYVNLKK